MNELAKKLGQPVSASHIYPFLRLLENEKLVMAIRSGIRGRTTYALTRKGKGLAQQILGRAGDLLYLAMKPRVQHCTHCGCYVLEGGHIEILNGKGFTFCCKHCAHAFMKENFCL